MSVLLFSMNIDIWVLCKMKSLRFKFERSLNLRKSIKIQIWTREDFWEFLCNRIAVWFKKGTEGQYGQIRIALDFVSDLGKCLIALSMRYVGDTRIFASFDQSNEGINILNKYTELNVLHFRLISEANLLIDIFPQCCSRILIKGWVVYQSSKSIVLEILSASLSYSRPTQRTSKCVLWSKVRLKIFKAKLLVCLLLLPRFINCWVAKLYVYQKIHLFSNCLIEESRENRVAYNSRQMELNVFF